MTKCYKELIYNYLRMERDIYSYERGENIFVVRYQSIKVSINHKNLLFKKGGISLMKGINERRLLKMIFFTCLFVMLFSGLEVFAAEKTPPTSNTYTFVTPIPVATNITRCEIQVVATSSPVPAHKITNPTQNSMKVTVYVQKTTGANGSLVRGVQAETSILPGTNIEFYDKNHDSGSDSVYRIRDYVSSAPTYLSPASNGDTLVINVVNPIAFTIKSLKYNITNIETTIRRVECWSNTLFSNHANINTFQYFLRNNTIGGPIDVPNTRIADYSDFYRTTQSNVLYYSTHSGKDFLEISDEADRIGRCTTQNNVNVLRLQGADRGAAVRNFYVGMRIDILNNSNLIEIQNRNVTNVNNTTGEITISGDPVSTLDTYYINKNVFLSVSSLSDNPSTFTATPEWIYQISCIVTNRDTASKWCKYLNANNTHKIKGLFGYSDIETTHAFDERMLKYSQMRPMLDSYMNNMYRRWLSSRETPGFDYLAYATAIVNVESIYDSMFDVSKSSDGDATYRIYQFQREYENSPITEASLGDVKIVSGRDSQRRRTVTYRFAVPGKVNRPSDYLNITLPVVAGRTMTKSYLAEHLNSLNADDFDSLISKSDSGGFDDLLNEIRELRSTNLSAYKKYVLYWITYPEIDRNINAKRPTITRILNVNDNPIVKYATLVKNGDNYEYVLKNGVVEWKTEVLGRCDTGEEVPLN